MTKIVPPQVNNVIDSIVNNPSSAYGDISADIFKITDDIIIAKYPPACVVVNEALISFSSGVKRIPGSLQQWKALK
jgi:hypothetical protein